jgi:hypothetical protein
MSRCAIAPPLGWLKPDLIPPPWPGAYAPVVILISEASAGRGEGFATDWFDGGSVAGTEAST